MELIKRLLFWCSWKKGCCRCWPYVDCCGPLLFREDWPPMFLAWFCSKSFAVPFDFIFRKKVVCLLSMLQWYFHLEWGSEDKRTEMKYGFYCWLVAYNIYKMRRSHVKKFVVWNAVSEMFEKLSKISCVRVGFTLSLQRGMLLNLNSWIFSQ